MTGEWWRDDEALLASLGAALDEEVPAHVIEAGKAAFTWASIDSELVALVYDSATSSEALTATRSERARIRDLTFASPRLTVHVQVSGAELQGQVVPPRRGSIEMQCADGVPRTGEIDDEGWFTIAPVPASSFRLLWRTTDGATAVTDWLTL